MDTQGLIERLGKSQSPVSVKEFTKVANHLAGKRKLVRQRQTKTLGNLMSLPCRIELVPLPKAEGGGCFAIIPFPKGCSLTSAN